MSGLKKRIRRIEEESETQVGKKTDRHHTAVRDFFCAALGLAGWMIYGKTQMAKIPGLTFREALAYTTQGRKDAVITVGVIKDDQASWTVYGENGQELPDQLHTYEIGSLTKTFTVALISRAIREGKVDLNRAKGLDMNRESYGFEYSNYGYAVLGLVLESVYETDYTALVNDYVRSDLGLTATKITDQSGYLGNL